MVKIFPSILAADFTKLGEELKKVINDVDGFHIDVMDGRFVPNISFGFPVLESLRKNNINSYFDTHLMIVEPDKFIEKFAQFSNGITVHYETADHLHRTISQIKDFGCHAGVSLNPHTPVSVLEEIIPFIDRVLLMSVNPGFGGQQFIYSTYSKIHKLKVLADKLNPKLEIQIDGGVGPKNINELVNCGANSFVVGSSVFKAEDPHKAVLKMREEADK